MSWRNIPQDAMDLVKQKYTESGFCLETRFHLAPFVETNFTDANVDDVAAANRAFLLKGELKTYIESISNMPHLLTSKMILQSTYENLEVYILFMTDN